MVAKHPLDGNKNWKFSQPSVGIRAHYVAVDREGKDPVREVLTLTTESTCREGVIGHTRQAFQTRLTNLKALTALKKENWRDKQNKFKWKPTRDCDLVDLAGKKNPTQLKIQYHAMWTDPLVKFSVEEFIKVCDRILGPVAVLLGPSRPEGEKWWKTEAATALKGTEKKQYIHWRGSDSWFLAHPATMSIATGLYRQCFHLCGAGVADQIIETLSEEEVSEVMSSNSQKLALLLIKKTRPWIEVPAAQDNVHNYAFPIGFWRRLIRLQRAIRQHGYEKALGQSFHEGWHTTGTREGGYGFTGTYAFWGDKGALTDHHRHLMKVGAPRRRQSGKSAKKAT